MKTRYTEDLRDKYPDEEIWIVGTGPSLDDFPDNFFKGKISIGLNFSFVAFPRLTYFITGLSQISELMMQINPELAKKTIRVLNWERGKYKSHPQNLPSPYPHIPNHYGFGAYKQDAIYMTTDFPVRGNIKNFKKALKPVVENIIKKKKILHGAYLKTIADYAIQTAAILGAKQITLVGCEARTTKHSFHAQKRGMHAAYSKIKPELAKDGASEITYSIKYQTGKTETFYKLRLGTKLQAEAFAPYGIKIQRYYYGIGYKNII